MKKQLLKKLTFILLLLSTNFVLNAQCTLSQLGIDIDGEAAGDQSGRSVSLSADGSTVAIGANTNDGNGSDAGHVRVYKNISGTWTKQGADIDGEAGGDQSGWSVSLSADGSTVAIGAYLNDGNGSNAGHVRVYKNISGTWTQQGADIDGEAAGDNSGWSVSLSADGSTVAIAAYLNDGNGSNAGHVRVYKNISGTWTQQGVDIDGEADTDLSGYSVFLSADGSTVAIGAYGNDDNGSNAGHVRVYKNISGTWTQQGADINGEAAFDRSGWSVSLSADGSTVAIGAIGNGSNAGHVRVYKNISGTWTKQGADIDGEAGGDQSGYSASLSVDGSTVAIGAYGNDDNGSNAGHVRVYKNISGTWTQQGADIDGEAASDISGYSVFLSADGLTVALGAIGNAGNGSFAGHVRVYQLSCASPEINVKGNNVSIIDADIAPSITDSTDFGTVASGSKRRYKILNTGTDTLKITSSTVTGTNALDFTITSMPTFIKAGDSASFTITFTTVATGARIATITINNNDANEAAYDFAISGNLTNCQVHNSSYNDTMTNTDNDSSAFNCVNWKSGKTPDSMVNIRILSGAELKIRPSEILNVHNIFIENGGKLLMSGGTLKVFGSIETVQSQALFATSGAIIFMGSDTNKIINCIPRVFNLEINKPSGVVWIDGGGLEIKNHANFVRGIVGKSSNGGSIEIMTGGTSTEGNPLSYVACRVQKYGSTDFIYPIGKGGKWARCGISNFGGTTCGAEYFDEGLGLYDTTTPLHHVSKKEYWDISPDGGSADIKLYWEDDVFSGIDLSQTDSNLRVAHFNSFTNKWEDMGNAAISFSSNGWISSNTVSDFSPFTFGSLIPAIPLPVEFINFTAKGISNTSALLKWQTASEVNNSHFEIERSLNGVNFIKVGTVNANGTNTLNYQYIDNSISIGTTKAFYRIKQVDENGKSASTNIQLVIFGKIENQIAVYPNPASTNVTISLPTETENANITLIDAMGKVLWNKSIGKTENMDLSSFSAGIYTLSITSNTETQNIKVIKQ